jgi:tetratricopeptide (TPR) repeat protein
LPWVLSSHPREEREQLALQSIRAHPRDGRAWYFWAEEQKIMGLPAAGEEEALLRAIAYAPDFALARIALAKRYASVGKASEAVSQAIEAVKLAPWDVRAVESLALGLASQRQCPDALAMAERARELLPESPSRRMRAELDAELKSMLGDCLAPLPTDKHL